MKKCFIAMLAVAVISVASCSYALDIFRINAPTLSDAEVGKNVSYTFTVTDMGGNSTAGVEWSISGSVPDNMSFSSGRLSGSPTRAGVYSFTVTVRRRYSTNYTPAEDSVNCTLRVVPAGEGGGSSGGESNTGGELSIGGTLMAEHVGTVYPRIGIYSNEVIGRATADGGTPPYTWSVVKGYVPKGMCLGSPSEGHYWKYNNHTGSYTTLCGIPVLEGAYDFTLEVTDSAGQSATRDFSITVDGGDIDDLSIGGDDFDGNSFSFDGVEYFSKTIGGGIAEGGFSPYTWSVAAGNLPTGLRLLNGDENFYEQHEITINKTSHEAYLKGTPYGAGTFKFILKVTDRDGRSAYREYTLVLDKGDRIDPNANGSETLIFDLPEIDGEFISSGTVGQSYSGNASASGGTAPYTWSLSYGELPEGVSLAGSTGKNIQFTGKPIAQGFYNFTLKVTDSKGNSNARTFMIKVAEAPSQSSTTDTPTTNTPNIDIQSIDIPMINIPTTDTPTTDTPTTDTPTTDTPTTDTPAANNTGNTDTNNTTGQTTNNQNTGSTVGSSGGGGCNTGLGLFALAVMAILKRSR